MLTGRLLSSPIPAPDELLYSVLARYSRMAGNLPPRLAAEHVLGSAQRAAVWDLPVHMKHAAELLGIPAPTLIDSHTLFPYVASGLLHSHRLQLRRWMMGDRRGGSVHASSGITASAVAATQHLRYCPQCARSDAQDWGAPVWRRLHQCPGVLWCSRHARPLMCSAVVVSARSHKHQALPLQLAMHSSDRPVLVVDPERADALARRTIELLAGAGPAGANAWRLEHLAALDDRGWRTTGGRIRWSSLLPQARIALPQAWWASLGLRTDLEHPSHWLAGLLRAPRRAAHPLLHLLAEALLNALEAPPERPATPTSGPRTPSPYRPRRRAGDRRAWQTLSRKEPASGPKGWRAKAPALYARLYRHSPDWLRSWNRSHRGKRQAPASSRRNWAALDSQLAQQVPAAFRALATGRQSGRRQVTRTALLRCLRTPALHRTQLAKLPRVQRALDRIAEDREAFLRRRLNTAMREWAASGLGDPRPWQLLRSSGVRSPWSRQAFDVAEHAIGHYPWLTQFSPPQDVTHAAQELATPGNAGSAIGRSRLS